MLKAAIVGVGFMGWMHYLAYQRSSLAQLVGFQTRDPQKRLGDWTSIKGNFGPPGEMIDVSDLQAYATYDDLLADPDVDMVDICLPPHLHVKAACEALEAGKHVLCEKPLGLTTEQCDEILEAAKTAGKQVMTAQVLPYMGEFQAAYEASRSGAYGTVQRAHFKRVISPPDWIPDFYDPHTVGGPLIDLHVHDAHFVRLLFGMPRRVMASAKLHEGIVQFCYSLMEFDQPGIIVGTSCGVSQQDARPFCHGFEIQFEKAVMQYELSALADGADLLPLRVLGQNGKSELPNVPGSDEVSAFTAEIDDAARSIETGTLQPRLDGATARDAIHICQCLQASAVNGHWVDCR